MTELRRFLDFIQKNNGIKSKTNLIKLVNANFVFIQDRTLYYSSDKSFAVRFSYSGSGSFSNTVLSLSKLQKYDTIPVMVCLVTPSENKIYLMNSTFLTKISHSSQTLSVRNIKGSFNGSDIIKSFNDISNNIKNVETLFAIHDGLGFEMNIERLVEATSATQPTGKVYDVSVNDKKNLLNAPIRAKNFIESNDFKILKKELDARVETCKNEIMIASHIENVNMRGRLIEYLITENDDKQKEKIILELHKDYSNLSKFRTENTLGDYQRNFASTLTATDIKTKILLLNSNPKAYNIDKFLKFHAQPNTVFLFYFIGINDACILNKILISVFQKDLLNCTILLKQWAGRNSRGVTQFEGKVINTLLTHPNNTIDIATASDFIEKLVSIV